MRPDDRVRSPFWPFKFKDSVPVGGRCAAISESLLLSSAAAASFTRLKIHCGWPETKAVLLSKRLLDIADMGDIAHIVLNSVSPACKETGLS